MEKNYKFSGGIKSLIKCIFNTLLIQLRRNKVEESEKIEILTFSILPSITLHWLNILTKIFPSKNIKYTVGDCSGSFRGRRYYPDLRHVPFINLEHGVKIDIFIRKVCNSEFILICDDDIFLIDRSPIDWALDKLKSNKKLAAVSLFPRPEYKKRLNDYFKLYDGINLRKDISRLMGSYCIIIRRDIWIRENLYFQQVKPENWKDVGNFFDTADYSNLKLIELGYKIEFAPKSLQNKLIFFSSLSLWGIKIQSTLGNIHEAIKPRPGEYEKLIKQQFQSSTLMKL